MANHPSAEKRNRQRVKTTIRNRSVRAAVRTEVKAVRSAITAKDAKAAQAALLEATVSIDKAATKGAIHPKAASRHVSRLAAQVYKLGKA